MLRIWATKVWITDKTKDPSSPRLLLHEIISCMFRPMLFWVFYMWPNSKDTQSDTVKFVFGNAHSDHSVED